MEFICLFCPAFISLLIMNNKNDMFKKQSIPYIISTYFIYNLLINFTILLVTKVLFNTFTYMFTISFSIKYIVLASILASILPKAIVAFNQKIVTNYKNKQILKKGKNFIYRHNKVFIFILLTAFFFGMDYYCRIKCYEVTEFYKVSSLSPKLLSLAYSLLFAGIISVLPKKLSRITLSIVFIFNMLLFIVQYFLLAIKKEAFTVYELTNANEGFAYLNCLIKEIKWDLIMIVVLGIAVYIICFILLGNNKKMKKKNIIFLLLVIVLFGVLRFVGIKKLGKYDPDAWDSYTTPAYYYINLTNAKRSLNVLGLYEYTTRDSYLYVKDLFAVANQKTEIKERISKKNYELKENEYTGIYKDKNLIMIMLESVDNLVVDKDTTPTLVKMKEKGLNFNKRYGQLSNGGVTIATEFTSITGLYYGGKYYNIYKNKYANSIPSAFAENGYEVSFIHENSGIYYNRSVLTNAMGFPNSYFLYDYLKEPDHNNDVQLADNDKVYNKIVNNKKGKFMTFITTISAHGPYVNNYPCSASEEAMSSELSCFRYLTKNTDDFLALLLDRLKEDELLDDTVIVLFTDHYAYTYDFTKEELAQTYNKVDKKYNIKNLPFIIYSTNIKHKDIDDIIVNDIDILPTIFNMFGIDYNPNLYIGTDVFADYHKNLAMFTDYSWYDGEIYSFDYKSKRSDDDYKEKTKYTKETFELNEMIVNNNYYANKKTTD